MEQHSVRVINTPVAKLPRTNETSETVWAIKFPLKKEWVVICVMMPSIIADITC